MKYDQSILRRVTALAWLCALACTALASPVLADDKKVLAQELFDNAMALIKQGNFVDACPKLAESQTIDPQIGTLFQLANCEQQTNKLASAWANFISVAARAASVNKPDHAKEAQARADLLKVRLTRLLLLIPAESRTVPGFEVRRDDIVIGPASFGVPLPVDSGKHVIKVSATGKRTWETTVETAGEGATITVSIPGLKEEPSVGPVGSGGARDGQSTSAGWSGQHTAGVVMAGAGLVGLGVMAGFGIDVGQKHNASKPYCSDDRKYCEQPGLDLEKQAHASASISNASLAVGATLLAAGVTVFLLAPSLSTAKPQSAPGTSSTPRAPGSPRATVSIRVTAGPSAAGAVLQGAF